MKLEGWEYKAQKTFRDFSYLSMVTSELWRFRGAAIGHTAKYIKLRVYDV